MNTTSQASNPALASLEPIGNIRPITAIDLVEPIDPDLAEQANPGHGVPSQDPSVGAQVALPRAEAEREAKSTLVGGGAIAGMLAGAATGAVLGGPVGVLVGGTVGTLAGALGGEAAGSMNQPAPETTAPEPAAPPPALHRATTR